MTMQNFFGFFLSTLLIILAGTSVASTAHPTNNQYAILAISAIYFGSSLGKVLSLLAKGI